MIPKKVNICGYEIKIKRKDSIDAVSSFSFSDRLIILNTYNCDDDTYEALIHEISEMIHVIIGNRMHYAPNNSYEFKMDHSKFQIHNDILVHTLINNKIISI